METRLTGLVGCRIPIQQAGMGGAATVDLAAAVSGAGALGMLGAAGVPAAVLRGQLEEVSARTSAPFGVNFLMPFLDHGAVEVAAAGAALVEFFYGAPDPALVSRVHEGGARAAWQVGSLEEARAAAGSGVDLVVAQGVEAGGHVRGQVGLLPLLELVLGAVSVPVVAAGGLGSARTVAAVVAAGAAGARVGTRFLAAEEADVHPAYLDALVAARAEDTVLTTTFSHLWPDAPHRVLRRCVEEALASDEAIVGHTAGAGGASFPIPRLAPPCPGRTTTGLVGAMAHYAGQSVDHVGGPMPAAAIVAELAALL